LFNFIRWGSYFDDYIYSLKSNLVEFPLHIILVYINLYFFIPRFLVSKKYEVYISWILFSLGVLYILRTGLNYLLVTENIWPEADGFQNAFTFNHIIAVVIGELYVVALATAVKLAVDWVNQKQRLENLQKEQLQTELNFLKAQIQPHFFFNTLNNLYALTLVKSEEASEVVLKLSDIMQYVIYDASNSQAPLHKEISYIKNYISLEKIRHGDELQISIECEDNLEEVCIPPLIYLSFIENVFKHGVRNNPNFYVKIKFWIEEDQLHFSSENNYIETLFFDEGGLGVLNTKRRLDLRFKEEYSLKINSKDNIYKVHLSIPID